MVSVEAASGDYSLAGQARQVATTPPVYRLDRAHIHDHGGKPQASADNGGLRLACVFPAKRNRPLTSLQVSWLLSRVLASPGASRNHICRSI